MSTLPFDSLRFGPSVFADLVRRMGLTPNAKRRLGKRSSLGQPFRVVTKYKIALSVGPSTFTLGTGRLKKKRAGNFPALSLRLMFLDFSAHWASAIAIFADDYCGPCARLRIGRSAVVAEAACGHRRSEASD